MRNVIAVGLFLLMFAVTTSAPAKATANQEIQKKLEEMGYKFRVTDLGNFMLDFDILDDNGKNTGRKQRIFIASKPDEWAELKVYRVWTTVQKMKTPLSHKMANQFLMDNVNEKFGRWEQAKRADGYRLMYVVKVSAAEKSDAFRRAIMVVLKRSDAVEKTLTGKDEF